MKKTVYLCGPITGIPGGNFTAFQHTQEALEELGFKVFNPHEICGHLDHATAEHQDYMAECMPYVYKADIIATLEGFEKSDGCDSELYCARKYDKNSRYPRKKEIVPAFLLIQKTQSYV
jgi:nucleoside 2-deoxyribosyltransferase